MNFQLDFLTGFAFGGEFIDSPGEAQDQGNPSWVLRIFVGIFDLQIWGPPL